jgi:putative phosphoribosyl transferase
MKPQTGRHGRDAPRAQPALEGFADRAQAGELLAAELANFAGRDDVLVIGLPRGGVPVAFEIAKALHAPLDALVVRKLPTPGQPELAMGAVAPGGIVMVNRELVRELRIPEPVLRAAVAEEQRELLQREKRYRGVRPPVNVRHHIVILVDDGLATGSTMRAAVAALSSQRPAKLIVALPVAARWAVRSLRQHVDDVVCLLSPERFYAVGEWYQDFLPVSDDEVRRLLDTAAKAAAAPPPDDAQDEYVSHR